LILAWSRIEVADEKVHLVGTVLVPTAQVAELLRPHIALDAARTGLGVDIGDYPISPPDCQGMTTIVRCGKCERRASVCRTCCQPYCGDIEIFLCLLTLPGLPPNRRI
jgi:hypothetical protein